MRIFITTITVSLILFSTQSYAKIKKKESNISLKINNEINIKSITPDYFISGYFFNPLCSFNGEYIDNINVTDTVCFYKIKGEEQYYRTTTSMWFYDITRENSFSLLPRLTNLNKIPDNIDDPLKNKIMNHNKNISSIMTDPLLRIWRTDLEYNDKKFNRNGSTDLSYLMHFYLPRSEYSCCFYDSILIELLIKPKLVTEILYVETYTKNFTVNNVEFFHEYEINNKTNDYDDLRWDFVKNENINYLIVQFKMDSSPIGDFMKIGIKIKVNGTYTK